MPIQKHPMELYIYHYTQIIDNMKCLSYLILVILVFSSFEILAQPNKYAVNALVMINGESGEKMIWKAEKMLAIDSLEIYNEDSAYILTSFRFTATFPGGMADFISDSSNLTEEMKGTLSILKRNGFVLFSEFVIKNEYGELIKPYYDSIYIQIVD
ncbi:MAG TPA: hypothetical protein DCG22_08035 [Bacteroidetes bacterium]|nr:hypothetical protein [Bacteroidota bacterium]